ncbi:MAG: hypothetical protein ACM30G_13185 [Micromonosporaceae bacterium]
MPALGDPPKLRRLLLDIDGQPCPFACTYCFASFSQFQKPPTLADLSRDESLLDGVDVIYPACDTDLFARPDALEILAQLVPHGRSLSISTKAHLSATKAASLARLHARLRDAGAVMKIGVSISTKHRVDEIEPRTPRYPKRIDTLAQLSGAGVPCALVLKPMLAEIPDSEYEEIVRDGAGFADAILVGDEWLEENDRAVRQPVGPAQGAHVVRRRVNWLDGQPEWLERSIPGRSARIRARCAELGLPFFDSDLDLMSFVISSYRR